MNKALVLFDGVCNLCNGSVLFILKRDPGQVFLFSALQSKFAHEQLVARGLDPDKLHSIIVLDGEKVYQRSRAALEIARRLSGLWPILYIFIVIPPFIRNWIYDLIAANRYRWFGRRDQCMIPTPQLKSRFIA